MKGFNMRISKRPKRIVAAAITAMFLSHQTLMMSVVASEITGVTGNNGVYPSALINGTDIGYRKYKDFTLDEGDIANLIYKYGDTDINTFINLVDGQVNINGLVNTMRNGNFHNGKAIRNGCKSNESVHFHVVLNTVCARCRHVVYTALAQHVA